MLQFPFAFRTVQDFEGEPVRVMLAEHLVAIMLQAGQLKDFVRAQMFLSQQTVDQDLLLDIINRHGFGRNGGRISRLKDCNERR